MDGVAGELLWKSDDFADSLPLGAAVASVVTPFVVITPLVTAGHVRAVMDLAEGRDVSAGGALGQAASRFPAVAVAVTLAWIGYSLGLICLIVPGVYLYVRWFVAPQAVAAEDRTGRDGLRYSRELVKGQWWRVFGIGIVISIIAGVLAGVLGIPFLAAGAIAESGPLTLIGQILLDAVVYSFTALAGTLLFFDLKIRHAVAAHPRETYRPDLPPRDLDAPERP